MKHQISFFCAHPSLHLSATITQTITVSGVGTVVALTTIAALTASDLGLVLFTAEQCSSMLQPQMQFLPVNNFQYTVSDQ